MTKVFLYFYPDQFDVTQIDSCFEVLPLERREKVLRYRRQIDKTNCILSYLLLVHALYKEYGLRCTNLSYSKTGKPYLPDYPNIHFNLSHCVKGCVCAVSNTPVGVDIQEIRPFSQLVANHCCNEKELSLLSNTIDPADAFTRIWSMKEAFLKMTGTGITQDLRRIDTTALANKIDIHKRNGCYIAIADSASFREEKICMS